MINFADVQDLNYWEKVYLEAFPPVEQQPMETMLGWNRDKEAINMKTIQDGETPIGLALWVDLGEDKAFLLYLAIDAEQRSNGYGGRVLEAFKALYPGGVVLEAELLMDGVDNLEQRKRRYKFYEKNGLMDSSYAAKSLGGVFHLMRSTPNVSVEDYLEGVEVLGGFPTFVSKEHNALMMIDIDLD